MCASWRRRRLRAPPAHCRSGRWRPPAGWHCWGMAAVAAIWPVWLFVVRPAISPAWQLGPKLTRRVRRYAIGAFAFSLLANIVALVVQAAAISGPADLLQRSDDNARRYPLRHLVAGAGGRPARLRRGPVGDRLVVAVAEAADNAARPRRQRGAAVAVLDDLPRRSGAGGAGDRGRLRLRPPPRRVALGGRAPLPGRRAGADRARPHRRRAARGPGSRPAALLAAGADRLGRDGVHRSLLRLAPGRQYPGAHRDPVRADAHPEADPDRAAARCSVHSTWPSSRASCAPPRPRSGSRGGATTSSAR